MESFFHSAVQLVTGAAIVASTTFLAAHVVLQFYIDRERVMLETGEPGWKVFGSALAAREFYKEEVWWLWHIRRIALVVSFVAILASILISAGAEGRSVTR